jgi:hypothetical protein
MHTMLKMHTLLQQENKSLKELLQQAEAAVADQACSITILKDQVAALEHQLLAKEFNSSKNEIVIVRDIDLTSTNVVAHPPPQDFNPLLMSGAFASASSLSPKRANSQELKATPAPPALPHPVPVQSTVQSPAQSPAQSPHGVQEILFDDDHASNLNRAMSCITMDTVLCCQQDSDSTSSSSGILTRRPTPLPSLPSVSEVEASDAVEGSPNDFDFRKKHSPPLPSITLRTLYGEEQPAKMGSHVSDHSDSNASEGTTTTMAEEKLPVLSPKHSAAGTNKGGPTRLGILPRTFTPPLRNSNATANNAANAATNNIASISTTTKKRPIMMRTGTPAALPGKRQLPRTSTTGVVGTNKTGTSSITNAGDWEFHPRGMLSATPEIKEEEDPSPSAALPGMMSMPTATVAPAQSANTRGESEDTLPTSNTTRTAPTLAITSEEDKEDESVLANAMPGNNSMPPPLRGPCRTSSTPPLPSKVAPKSTAARGSAGTTITHPAILEEEKKEDPHKLLHPKGPGGRTSTPLPPRTNTTKLEFGDFEKIMLEEQDEEPRPAGRIMSNAVKGLPRELSIQGHDDDDDITMASLTKKNELSQTKEVHKRQVVDAFGERGMYTGSLNVKSHLPDGYGEMQYRQKRSYKGDWSQGHWHGHGQFLNNLKDVYEGEFVMDQKEGQGKLIFNDGRVFTGRFQKDQMREGKLHFQDASFYQGLLRDGKRSGFGLYVFSDQQSQYEGQWESDCMHGRGRMDWSDRGLYNGDWEMGLQHGIGMEVSPDGTLRHRGKWDKGNPVHEAVQIG